MDENELIQKIKYLIEIVPNINETLETLITELEESEKSFSELDSDYIDLVKQNKRYREAIEKVLYETGDKVIQNILETALEADGQ